MASFDAAIVRRTVAAFVVQGKNTVRVLLVFVHFSLKLYPSMGDMVGANCANQPQMQGNKKVDHFAKLPVQRCFQLSLPQL